MIVFFFRGDIPGVNGGVIMSPRGVKTHVFRQYSPSSSRIRGPKNFLKIFSWTPWVLKIDVFLDDPKFLPSNSPKVADFIVFGTISASCIQKYAVLNMKLKIKKFRENGNAKYTKNEQKWPKLTKNDQKLPKRRKISM